MKNSKELCHPLSMPFACLSVDSRETEIPGDSRAHYFAELFLLREGALHVTLEQEEITLSPGMALMVCPGARHQVRGEGSLPAKFDLIRLDPDRIPGQVAYAPPLKVIFYLAHRDHLPMVFTPEETAELGLSDAASRCIRETAERRFGFDLSTLSVLSMACLALVRFWLSRGLNLDAAVPPEDPLCSLTGYIQQHLRDNLRVEELAARCGLSYPWFAKKFREIYSVSCKDYIEQIRVAQVENYLLFTDMDLSRISEATGYADCSHMIKNFKRMKEITPGQYRLKHRQNLPACDG